MGNNINTCNNRKRHIYKVQLPAEVDIPGYNALTLSGETEAFSERQAVSHFVARQNRRLIGLVMYALDNQYGGAEYYAFQRELQEVEVYQTKEDLQLGGRMTREDISIITEYEQARLLALNAGVDVKNPKNVFPFLDIVRRLKYR